MRINAFEVQGELASLCLTNSKVVQWCLLGFSLDVVPQ